MAEALHDRQTIDHQPQLSRRAVLAGAIGLALHENLSALLAQEVKHQSANELLRKLPEKIRLAGGTEATVDTVEVPDARYLLVAIRSVHAHEPEKMTAEEWKVVNASSREIDQIIVKLHQELGITTYAPEGFTPATIHTHQEIMKRLTSVPPAIAKFKKLKRPQEAAELETLLKGLEKDLEERIPYPGVLSLLKNGKMQIIAAETEEAQQKAEKVEKNRLTNRHMGSWYREDASLQLLHSEIPNLKKGPGVISPWGASHWQPFSGKPPKEKPLPARLEVWNNQHRNAKFSCAIITPPTAKECVRTHPFPPPPER